MRVDVDNEQKQYIQVLKKSLTRQETNIWAIYISHPLNITYV